SPKAVTHVVLVLRTFPIRVAGQSGPLQDEISWEQLQVESSAPFSLREYTTVTKKLRRVGRFDPYLARAAVRVNRPDFIALNFLDHLEYRNRSIRDWKDVQAGSKEFVLGLEGDLGVPIRFCGTGPHVEDVIDRCVGTTNVLPDANASQPLILG